MKRIALVAVVVALFAIPIPASADLLTGLAPATGFMVTGTGLGAVATLVTMSNVQDKDADLAWESGCTGGNGTGKASVPGSGCYDYYGLDDFGKYDPRQDLIPLDSIIGVGETTAQRVKTFCRAKPRQRVRLNSSGGGEVTG